jgi:hypothetical protein
MAWVFNCLEGVAILLVARFTRYDRRKAFRTPIKAASCRSRLPVGDGLDYEAQFPGFSIPANIGAQDPDRWPARLPASFQRADALQIELAVAAILTDGELEAIAMRIVTPTGITVEGLEPRKADWSAFGAFLDSAKESFERPVEATECLLERMTIEAAVVGIVTPDLREARSLFEIGNGLFGLPPRVDAFFERRIVEALVQTQSIGQCGGLTARRVEFVSDSPLDENISIIIYLI